MLPLCVVLDLDNTLVAAAVHQTDVPVPHDAFHVNLEGSNVIVRRRPGLDAFFQALRDRGFVVMMFTSSVKEYALDVLSHIDPQQSTIQRCFSQEHTNPKFKRIGGKVAYLEYVKALDVCAYPLSRCVLVDDNVLSFLHNPLNGILIPPFYFDDDSDDDSEAFHDVISFLDILNGVEDVRTVIKSHEALYSKAI